MAWRQAIIWTNARILLIEPLRTNFSRNSNIFIHENAFESVVRKMASILPGLHVLSCSGVLLWCISANIAQFSITSLVLDNHLPV